MGITCTPTVDVSQIIQPLMLSSVFKEGTEFDISNIIDVYLQDQIVKHLLETIELPEEFADLGQVICLQLDMNKIKTLMAVLKGEAPPEGVGIDKILELVMNIQLLSSLGSALGGSESTSEGTSS